MITKNFFTVKYVKNINTKSSLAISTTHIGTESISRINNNHTDKTYTYINPEFDQVDALVERTVDDCEQFFLRFICKCVFVVKLIHETHATTSYFTLSNKFQNQYEQKIESMN